MSGRSLKTYRMQNIMENLILMCEAHISLKIKILRQRNLDSVSNLNLVKVYLTLVA